jgi:hypothetical protein
MVLDDLIPADHMCRVIAAFVGQFDIEILGFERAPRAGPILDCRGPDQRLQM